MWVSPGGGVNTGAPFPACYSAERPRIFAGKGFLER